ncbi:hypothetical protein [Burkholderia pseudomallei]|uniref:hypothetical protein n=1 Tax=Burkholderia pseudomallei TaxID=28450 RepID=UPI000F286D7A|nr:hypothetical protein [Burkholderia pseudomallei]VBQ81336.1 Uncharacterised protein [Burkholderia pseudomallei]
MMTNIDSRPADALTEAATHTIATIKRQLDLIAERAPGDFLDKRPVVQSLGAHVRRLEKALAASPVEQSAQMTAQAALAAIETFEIVGENNDSREPNDDDRFILNEFIAHLFGGYSIEKPASAPPGTEPPRHIVDAAMDVARHEYGHGVTRSSIVAIWKALGSPWYMPAADLPAPVLDALRFYANGHHFNIDSEHQQFDTVSGEPANWLFSERDDDCTMIEDGSVARAALCGAPLGFEEPEAPVEGEVFGAAAQMASHERAELVARQPYQWRDTGALETGDA